VSDREIRGVTFPIDKTQTQETKEVKLRYYIRFNYNKSKIRNRKWKKSKEVT